MADKVYLDAEGVKRLKEYIDDQIMSLKKAIDLLKDTNGTPGSIQNMIDDAINNVTLDNIDQEDEVVLYGGQAPQEEANP